MSSSFSLQYTSYCSPLPLAPLKALVTILPPLAFAFLSPTPFLPLSFSSKGATLPLFGAGGAGAALSSLSSSDDSLALLNPNRRRLVTLRGLGATTSVAPFDEAGGSSAADLAMTGLACLEWSRDEEAEEEEAEASASGPPLFDIEEKVRLRLTPERTPDLTAALMEWMDDLEGPGDSPKQYKRVVCGVIGGVGAAVLMFEPLPTPLVVLAIGLFVGAR